MALIGVLIFLGLVLLIAGASNNAEGGWRAWIPCAVIVALMVALWAAGTLH